MSALPIYVQVRMSDWSEKFKPNVEVSEMERGPDKYRVLNSRPIAQMNCSLLFRDTEDDLAFLDWFFEEIGQIGEFAMTHPRTGSAIQARFAQGDVGTLRSIAGTDALWQRDVVIEYMR